MPAKDKKKDELTLDTTSPPPRATVWRSPPPTTATTLNASAFALRASLTVYGSDPEIGCRAVLDGRLGASRSVRDPPSAGLLAPRPTRLDPPRFRTPSPPDTAVRVASESRSAPLVPLLPSQWLCVSDLDHVGADGMRSAWAQLAPWGAFALVSAFDLDPARGTSFADAPGPPRRVRGTASNPTLDPNRHRETNRRRLPRRRTPLGSTPDRRVVED